MTRTHTGLGLGLVVAVGLAATSAEVRGFVANAAQYLHDAFVVVFVDAANFISGCF